MIFFKISNFTSLVQKNLTSFRVFLLYLFLRSTFAKLHGVKARHSLQRMRAIYLQHFHAISLQYYIISKIVILTSWIDIPAPFFPRIFVFLCMTPLVVKSNVLSSRCECPTWLGARGALHFPTQHICACARSLLFCVRAKNVANHEPRL